jgi:L-ascorbate metabolism protein UlaG (beta-lactamase superfamily)
MPSNPYYAGPRTDHFDGLRFGVPGITRDKTRGDMFRWFWGRTKAAWPKHQPSPFHDQPPERVEGDRLRVTLVGHASVLIQTGGVNLLVDPVWAERASPFTFAGPKRVNKPGIDLDRLPPLDAILLSHNHYDHLDLTTLRRLAHLRPCRVITPLGNDTILRRADSAVRAEAFDWGARVPIRGDVAVHVEPAYHWSARGLGDRRMALWSAFVIEAQGGPIYHIADTAWGDGAIFPAARRKHGDFRLAILPIGAYEPRWFMRDQHVNPAESVRIFEACGAERAIGHHWGTFQLTDEAIEAPVRALHGALVEAGLESTRFQAFRPGQVFDSAVI